MKHPERVEDYLGHIAEAIERGNQPSSTVARDPFEARLARFAEAGPQRGGAAQLAEIVVGPGDRIGSEANHHDLHPSRC